MMDMMVNMAAGNVLPWLEYDDHDDHNNDDYDHNLAKLGISASNYPLTKRKIIALTIIFSLHFLQMTFSFHHDDDTW